MVTIKASYTVIPNQPTPKGRLWLSGSDQFTRPGHTPLVYIYKPKQNHEYSMERMMNTLSKILVHYYPIAGRLSLSKNGGMEVECNAKGVTLLEAETTKRLEDYGDFSPSEPIKELLPTIDYTQPIEELPLLFVQLTRFHDGQNLAIGVALSHPLGDGQAWIPFINLWAKVARGDTLEPHEMPFLDRTILKFEFPHQTPPPHFDHQELKPMPLILGKNDNIGEKKKKTTAALLKLTSKQVEMLKDKANHEQTRKGSRPFTRYEAVVAHIWRCASKARELDEKQPTLVRFNVDFRNRLNPPLPRNYFGNALAVTVTPTCEIGEIISNPLSYAAQKIREANERLTNEYIRSQMNVIVGKEQLDAIRGFFLGKGENLSTIFAGSPNLHITSWIGMPAYEADFGWGKPVFVGLGYVCPFDRAIITLGPEGDGSVVVVMHFQVIHMQLFKKFFYEDILFTSRL
ncbi:hypothetical protein RJT34_00403 [Clitoria ternatea]|uniref:Spermidine hydroxycinnamoyl transferase n=1 Tax=Clitoria ternatea TaxID=43366 RepID=A0AAN9PY10_CLITE